ncbi:MAG: ribonuclease H-like domain-containing protein [Candidatus Moduliflexus flocculans]|nr:ribonuclease H-like domain-containing protein [Candidatus Moduliflexus flocculans]
MPLEDKLKQLRREREARSRAQSVEKAWERIDEDARPDGQAEARAPDRPDRQGPGPGPRTEARPVEVKRREPVQVFENSYVLGANYGQIPIAMGLQIPADILGFLSREAAFDGLDLSTAVFLDLETTGLAGGTGTVPFLVGLAYFRDERFKVTQFFLNEMAEEDRLVRELAQFVQDMGFKSIVTYNGKAFDMPLVETRFAMHRTPCPLRGLPHLDFLFSARSLWKHKYDSCRLFNLAQQIVPGRAVRGHPRRRDPAPLLPVHPQRRLLAHRTHPLPQPGGPAVAPGRCRGRGHPGRAPPGVRGPGRRRRHGPLRRGQALREGRRRDDVGGPARAGPGQRPWPDGRGVPGRPQEALPSLQEEQGLGQGAVVLAGGGRRGRARQLPRAGDVLRAQGQGPRRGRARGDRGPGPGEGQEALRGREGFREAHRPHQGQDGQREGPAKL